MSFWIDFLLHPMLFSCVCPFGFSSLRAVVWGFLLLRGEKRRDETRRDEERREGKELRKEQRRGWREERQGRDEGGNGKGKREER